jgi:hypothetical protein
VPLQAQNLFKQLPSLVDVDVPSGSHITVCGDVHGQYYDLLNIFKLNGMPSADNPYLFNGGASGAARCLLLLPAALLPILGVGRIESTHLEDLPIISWSAAWCYGCDEAVHTCCTQPASMPA